MSYSIEFSKRSQKDLDGFDNMIAGRCLSKIETLKENPFPQGVIKVKGEDRAFRIRVGKYRILYEVYNETKIILIVKMDNRDRVYD